MSKVIKASFENIYNKLDEYAVGQEEAKKALAYAGFMHQSRIAYKFMQSKEIKKSTVLLLGPTGCGKTFLSRKLAEILNLPFYEMSALDFSRTGYVGNSIEEHIEFYIKENEKFKQEELEYGIIFIDEVDKLAKPSITSGGNDTNAEMQDVILKTIEGYNMMLENKQMNRNKSFNTTNVLFILAGSFAHMANSRKKKGIGFANDLNYVEKTQDRLHKQVVKAGIKPELSGRISLIAELNELTKEDLNTALFNTKDCLFDQYKGMFEFLNKELNLSDEEIDLILNNCIKNETGARGLQTELDKILSSRANDLEYEISIDVHNITDEDYA